MTSGQLGSLIQRFVVSSLNKNLFSLWDSLDSVTSGIVFPLVDLAMSTIAERLQNIWRLSHADHSRQEPDVHTKHVFSIETQNRLKLREVLEAQHRMMYYTVTISTLSPVRSTPVSERKTSTLRWQYASTLTKTRATMRKSTVHCSTFYNITYLGELLETDEEDDAQTDIEQSGVSVIQSGVFIAMNGSILGVQEAGKTADGTFEKK